MDYVLLHGNAFATPGDVRSTADRVRAMPGYRNQPLLINEDDHYNFDSPDNNFLAAVQEYVGWGYFDYRQVTEKYRDGFQSLPVDWRVDSTRKLAFFRRLSEVTGYSDLNQKSL